MVKVIFFYNLVDGISLLWKAHIVVLINLTLVLTSTYMRSFLSLETSQKMPTSRPPPAKSFCLWKRHNKAPFGRVSPAVSRAASDEALPNVCFRTGFMCEAGSEAVGGLHRQGEAMKSWLHAAYTSI